MRITINHDDGVVIVDGQARKVDLSALDAAIHAVQFDTTKGAGHIEFHEDATIGVLVRDADAEAAAYDACNGDVEKLAALQPIFKTVQAHRDNEPLAAFDAYQPYLDAWKAAAPVVVAPTLADLRLLAAQVVDVKAEAVRMRYLTPGAGQAGTYIEKATQSDSFRAAGYPAAAVPPMVQAEADATGQTPQQAADVILATRDAWLAKGADIERERRRGKVTIDAAADAAGVAAARDAAVKALDAL